MPITVEARESVGLDAGMYTGKIIDLIEETGQYGEQIKLVIEVDGLFKDNGEPQSQWAWASKTLTPKSKLWKWIKNISGQTPQIGANFTVDDALLGQHVGFMVSINDTGRSVVTDITKPSGGQARKTAAKAAAPVQQQVEQMDPCVICDEPGTRFTSKGKPVCDDHGE